MREGGSVLPVVIEPSVGVDRLCLAVLCEAFREVPLPPSSRAGEGGDGGPPKTRRVLQLPRHLAPFRFAVLPLSKRPELAAFAEDLWKSLLSTSGLPVDYDITGTAGVGGSRAGRGAKEGCVSV